MTDEKPTNAELAHRISDMGERLSEMRDEIREGLKELTREVRAQNGRVATLETRIAVSDTRLAVVEHSVQNAGAISKTQAAGMAGAGGALTLLVEFLLKKIGIA